MNKKLKALKIVGAVIAGVLLGLLAQFVIGNITIITSVVAQDYVRLVYALTLIIMSLALLFVTWKFSLTGMIAGLTVLVTWVVMTLAFTETLPRSFIVPVLFDMVAQPAVPIVIATFMVGIGFLRLREKHLLHA